MTACTSIPVVLIHHDPLVRACMAAGLESRSEFDVRAVLQHADGLDDLRIGSPGYVLVADQQAAMLLASVAMQRHLLSSLKPSIAVVSSCDREWELRSALAQRVRGYLSPGFDMQRLMECIAAVHEGSRYLCQRSAARLAESLSYETLTERETGVLRLVVRGLPNKSIGRELNISVGTVKSHLKSAYAKLLVCSRTQAVAETQRRGLLEQTADIAASRPVFNNAALHAVAPKARLARPIAIGSGELRAA